MDFNSKKFVLKVADGDPIKKSKYEFHFHFIFIHVIGKSEKKKDLQVQVRPLFFLENSFQILFLYFLEEKTGEKWKSNDGFLGVKIRFQVFGFRHCQYCKSVIRIFKSAKSRFFI